VGQKSYSPGIADFMLFNKLSAEKAAKVFFEIPIFKGKFKKIFFVFNN
jgi:hypothetical protein